MVFLSNNAIAQQGPDPLDSCGYTVTSSICLGGNQYEMCFRPSNQNLYHEFQIWEDTQGGLVFLGSCSGNADCCIQYTTIGQANAGLVIRHYSGQNNMVELDTCPENTWVLPDCDDCSSTPIVDIDIDYTDCTNPEVTFTPIGTIVGDPYNGTFLDIFLSFGDGNDLNIESPWTSSNPITHVYPGTGSYTFCITAIQGTLERPQTCCWDLFIDDEECCPEDLVEKCGQFCGGLDVCVTDELFNGGGPYEIDLDDGNGYFVTSDYSFSPNYDSNYGVKTICVKYINQNANQLECCYDLVYQDICCPTADFSFTKQELSRSCINDEFTITPDCIAGEPNQHTWYFSDGKVFQGPVPPANYIFTDFLNSTGEVCVTHEIECCGNVQSVTRCLPHPTGAYVGLPGEQRKMTDPMPDPQWGATVYDFCKTYSVDPNYPLLIDGIIINDRFSDFTDPNGEWNFGEDAGLLNENVLLYDDHTLQSAGAYTARQYSCCWWTGIEHDGATWTELNNSKISQADAAIHYPSLTQPVGFWPFLEVDNTDFINNQSAVKSLNQYVNIGTFSGNFIDGFDNSQHICACGSAYAIDFRDIQNATTIIFPLGAQNEITNYAQGFHFENTPLKAYNFNIHHLADHGLVLTDPDRAIGIDFYWAIANPGLLEFDQFIFEDFNDVTPNAAEIGVRMRILGSDVQLNASSNQIDMARLNEGYNILTTGCLSGEIEYNEILEARKNGINVQFTQECFLTDLLVKDNEISVNGTFNEAAGISISSLLTTTQQDVRILENTISVGLQTSPQNSYGIFNDRVEGLEVRENLILPGSGHGIFVNQGGSSVYACNTMDDRTLSGMKVIQSNGNDILNNEMINCGHSLTFHGASSFGSEIKNNTFDDANDEEITYEASSVTGQQNHNYYNFWLGQELTAGEVVHFGGAGFNATQCQFYVPQNQSYGDVHRPYINTTNLEDVVSLPFLLDDICLSEVFNPGGGQFLIDPNDTETVSYLSQMIDGGMTAQGYTDAEKLAWEEQIYHQLLVNTDLRNASSELQQFFTQAPYSFAGAMVDIEQLVEQSQDLWSAHYEQHSTEYQTLKDNNQSIEDLIPQLKDTNGNIDPHIEAQITQLQADNQLILDGLESDKSQVATQVHQLLSNASTNLQNLPATGVHQLSSKFMLEMAIKQAQGHSLTEADWNEIRTIAQTCFPNGGSAVYTARGLLWSQKAEYYDKVDCSQSARGQDVFTGKEAGDLVLSPNPAMDQVKLQWDVKRTGEQVDIYVIDLAGKPIVSVKGLQPRTGQYMLNTSPLQSGIYIVQVDGERYSYRGKLIVQH